MLAELAILFCILLSLLYFYLTQYYSYWKTRGVKYVEPSFIFGNFFDSVLFRKTRNQVHQDLYNAGAGHPYVGIIVTRKPALFIRDPEIIRHVLTKDFTYFHDRGVPVNEEKDPLSAHLFTIEGGRWRNLRTKLSPTFTSGKMKNMLPLMQQCADELLALLGKHAEREEVIEMREILARFTTDVIGTCAFGVQCNSLRNPDAEFRKMGAILFNTPSYLMTTIERLTHVIPMLGKLIPRPPIIKKMNNFFLEAIKENLRYREKNNVQRKDFLDLLMQIRKKGKITDNPEEGKDDTNVDNTEKSKMEDFELTDNRIAAQAFVFFIGGFDTSAATLSFGLTELARNPDIQEKLRSEVDETFDRLGDKLTYEALMTEMPYLDKVVSEILRMYPPVTFLFRKVTERYKMPDSDLVLDKDLMIIIPNHALQHDPHIFPNPETFDPERFSEENKRARHNYTYLPFGEGPRHCIGKRFGLLQVKLALSVLLRNFQFEMGPDMPYPLVISKLSFLMSTEHGTNLRISKRTPR